MINQIVASGMKAGRRWDDGGVLIYPDLRHGG